MSVYRDTNARATLEHPYPGPLTATVYRDGILLKTSDPITPVAGMFHVDLTYVETQFDGTLDIKWSNEDETFARVTSVSVVTPLVSLSKLQTLFADTNWTTAELAELENSVRIFIQSWTQQTFGYEIATYTVVGNGDSRITLPRRLISAASIAGGPPSHFSISNNGWELYIRNKNILTTKEAPPEEFMWVTQGVIYVPDSYWKQFRVGARYDITGEWGYFTVPEDVQEAAMILANDYACGDSLYRDRYLESLKAGDGNMVFSPGAYRATGNVRADQLLEPYRRQGMVII